MVNEEILKQIDELQEQLTNVINENESDDISPERREELDEMYLDLDNKINQLRSEISW